jgi:hypothetical protein
MAMGHVTFYAQDAGSFRGFMGFGAVKNEKILLRAPETCKECGECYKSLYVLKSCSDHQSLEKSN